MAFRAAGAAGRRDLVKLDVTIEKDGFMADGGFRPFPVGEVTEERKNLIACAERAFAKAMLVALYAMMVSGVGDWAGGGARGAAQRLLGDPRAGGT